MKTPSANLSDDEEAMLRGQLERYVPGPGWRPRPPGRTLTPVRAVALAHPEQGSNEGRSPGHLRLARVPHQTTTSDVRRAS